MKKFLISLKFFVSCKSTINFSSMRLDNFIQLLDTSSVIIGLEFVFLNLCLTISENLLSLSFQKNPDFSSSESRLGFSLMLEPSELSSCTGLPDLATNFLQESDKLVYGPLVLLAPE